MNCGNAAFIPRQPGSSAPTHALSLPSAPRAFPHHLCCLVDAFWLLTSLVSTPASPGSHVVRQVWGAVLLCDVWAGTSGYLLHHLFVTMRPLRPPAVVIVCGIGWHLPLCGTGLGCLCLLARHAVWCRQCGWAPLAPMPSGGGSTRARRVARLLTVVVVCGSHWLPCI